MENTLRACFNVLIVSCFSINFQTLYHIFHLIFHTSLCTFSDLASFLPYQLSISETDPLSLKEGILIRY